MTKIVQFIFIFCEATENISATAIVQGSFSRGILFYKWHLGSFLCHNSCASCCDKCVQYLFCSSAHQLFWYSYYIITHSFPWACFLDSKLDCKQIKNRSCWNWCPEQLVGISCQGLPTDCEEVRIWAHPCSPQTVRLVKVLLYQKPTMFWLVRKNNGNEMFFGGEYDNCLKMLLG